jgi:hypothetical protein
MPAAAARREEVAQLRDAREAHATGVPGRGGLGVLHECGGGQIIDRDLCIADADAWTGRSACAT